jgi:hypothetical protein
MAALLPPGKDSLSQLEVQATALDPKSPAVYDIAGNMAAVLAYAFAYATIEQAATNFQKELLAVLSIISANVAKISLCVISNLIGHGLGHRPHFDLDYRMLFKFTDSYSAFLFAIKPLISFGF